MLGSRGPQRGLFESDNMYADFVGRESFYGFLASQRGTLFRDEDFAKLYSARQGRPSVPPSLLSTALVLQTHDRVSDEEAKERADYDLRWKVALGVAVEDRPFAKSTLQEFRAQLVVHEEQGAIFQRSLEMAKRKGYFRGRAKLKVALDTTAILGRGAVKDTYNLLADGIRLVLRALAQETGTPVEEWARHEGLERYVAEESLKGQAEITWEDPQERRRFLQGIVTDAERALVQVRRARSRLAEGSPEDQAVVDAAGLLSRVLAQDIERREDGPALREGVAPDRMPSVHDPEMRHGRKSKAKRFDGHKAQVAVDTGSQIITAVAVLPGNAPDHEQALAVVEATEEATGCPVEETMGDCAYGDGGTRQEFADAGRLLIAKVPAATNRGLFPKAQFRIDLAAGSCTCPAEQTSWDLGANRTGGGVFQFPMAVCGPCSLRDQCVRGKGGRTVQLHPQERLLQEARRLQASPAFRQYRALRQAAEHRLARLIQLGLRQARYRGRAKTLFQLCMTAAVANLTLLAFQTAKGAAQIRSSQALAAASSLFALLLLLTITSTLLAPWRRPAIPQAPRPPRFAIHQPWRTITSVPPKPTSRPGF